MIRRAATSLIITSLAITGCATHSDPAPAPTPDPTQDSTQAEARQSPDGIAHLGGAAIHYDTHAWTSHPESTPPIVLVHGWASDATVWNDNIDALAALAPVIAIDLPGHARSDLPDQPITMDLLADAINAVLEDTSTNAAILIGHSNGTPTIRQFYRRHPDKTLALIAVDGAFQRMFGDAVAQTFDEALSAETYRTFVATMIRNMAAPSPDPDALNARIQPIAAAIPQRSLIEAFRAGADPDIWTDDPIDVPVLLVLARAPFWTDDYLADIHALIPDLTVEWFDTSHFVMMDDPARFNAAVIDFLHAKDLD